MTSSLASLLPWRRPVAPCPAQLLKAPLKKSGSEWRKGDVDGDAAPLLPLDAAFRRCHEADAVLPAKLHPEYCHPPFLQQNCMNKTHGTKDPSNHKYTHIHMHLSMAHTLKQVNQPTSAARLVSLANEENSTRICNSHTRREKEKKMEETSAGERHAREILQKRRDNYSKKWHETRLELLSAGERDAIESLLHQGK